MRIFFLHSRIFYLIPNLSNFFVERNSPQMHNGSKWLIFWINGQTGKRQTWIFCLKSFAEIEVLIRCILFHLNFFLIFFFLILKLVSDKTVYLKSYFFQLLQSILFNCMKHSIVKETSYSYHHIMGNVYFIATKWYLWYQNNFHQSKTWIVNKVPISIEYSLQIVYSQFLQIFKNRTNGSYCLFANKTGFLTTDKVVKWNPTTENKLNE